MDWEKLLWDSSRRTIDEAAEVLAANDELFPEAIELAHKEKKSISARAARAVFYCSENNPEMIEPYTGLLIETIPHLENESVAGTWLAIFAKIRLPENEDQIGHLTKICFDMLERKCKRISLKVYAVETIYKISQLLPELKNELILVIENTAPYSQLAYKSHGERILKKLYKEIG